MKSSQETLRQDDIGAIQNFVRALSQDQREILREYLESWHKKEKQEKSMKDYMTVQETTDYFGIDRHTLWDWEKKGLYRIKVGKRVYYAAKDIEAFMADHTECRYTR